MMMTIAGYDFLPEDILKEDSELEYTFQYSLLSKEDQKLVAEHKAKNQYTSKQKIKPNNKSASQSAIDNLVFKEDKYPSDHFGLFDAILGIISLVILFILFW